MIFFFFKLFKTIIQHTTSALNCRTNVAYERARVKEQTTNRKKMIILWKSNQETKKKSQYFALAAHTPAQMAQRRFELSPSSAAAVVVQRLTTMTMLTSMWQDVSGERAAPVVREIHEFMLLNRKFTKKKKFNLIRKINNEKYVNLTNLKRRNFLWCLCNSNAVGCRCSRQKCFTRRCRQCWRCYWRRCNFCRLLRSIQSL